MTVMSVTLDVSKLSGWLNALAYCRVEGGLMEGDMGGARWADLRRRRCKQRAGKTSWSWGATHARDAPQTCRTCS
eukprot:scaffold44781_cov43-Phaeocystis_antarctica.AAC.2